MHHANHAKVAVSIRNLEHLHGFVPTAIHMMSTVALTLKLNPMVERVVTIGNDPVGPLAPSVTTGAVEKAIGKPIPPPGAAAEVIPHASRILLSAT
jgi:hypothetical protein